MCITHKVNSSHFLPARKLQLFKAMFYIKFFLKSQKIKTFFIAKIYSRQSKKTKTKRATTGRSIIAYYCKGLISVIYEVLLGISE